MKRALRRSRGFTLIELIISMTIVLIAISLAGAGFVAQNQALQSSDLHRTANASTRDAMLAIEQTLRATGWGVDPRFAIDVYSARSPIDGSSPGSGLGSMDSVVAPDELTVVSRSPLYQWADTGTAGCTTIGGCFVGWAWTVSSLATGTQTIVANLATGQVLEKGRLIQIQCLGGENPVILTVKTRVTGTGGAANIVYENISSFPYNDSANLKQCHGQLASSGAALYVLDRSHFYVGTPGGAGTEPWLMLDTTVDLNNDTAITTADHIPVARNIEDFQVAYMLPTNSATAPDLPLGTGNYIIADAASGTNELPSAASGATDSPLYTDALDHTSRTTTRTANVKGIRVSLITRSARQDPNRPSPFVGEAVAFGENRTGTTPTGAALRYLRFPGVTQITLRNMDSQRPFTF